MVHAAFSHAIFPSSLPSSARVSSFVPCCKHALFLLSSDFLLSCKISPKRLDYRESFKQDGTRSQPVTIWVVRVGDDVYVRAYRGRETAWFQHIQRRPEGRIEAGGVTKDVTFVDASSDEALNNEIDAAYQSKYRRYSATYVDPMIAPQARATTLKLVPTE
jgi:hypothetical protein